MKPFHKRKINNPEHKIQDAIILMLRGKGWFVKPTHGNIYQHGFPDLYATHYRYGARWIEVKNPKSYKFTSAQMEDFPHFCANGSGVWILVAATEVEYKKLMKPCNWYQYLAIMRGFT